MKRTKLGTMFYDFTLAVGDYLLHHKVLYIILSYTWGLAYTLFGLIASLVIMLALEKKPQKWLWSWYFKVGSHWGGFEMGRCFLTDETPTNGTRNHEFGHSIQNAIFGPFIIFIEVIPSAIRYWYRSITGNNKKPYDLIWFEGSASELGYLAYAYQVESRVVNNE